MAAAVSSTTVGSICGLEEGQTEVDWSEQGLGVMDAKLIAVDLQLGRFSRALVQLNVAKNLLGHDGQEVGPPLAASLAGLCCDRAISRSVARSVHCCRSFCVSLGCVCDG